MMKKLHEFLISDHYRNDDEELRKATMLVNAILLSTLFGIFYFFNTVYFEMHHIMYNMIFAVCAFSTILILFKNGLSRIVAANIFTGVALFSSIINVLFSQGLFSWSFDWFTLAPILAILFTDKKQGYYWFGITLVIAIILGSLSMAGIIYPDDVKAQYLPLMTFNSSIGLVAILFLIAVVLDNAYSRSMEKLSQKNLQIESEKLKAEQERKRAEESEQAKQQFLANMSHEIRTPINALMGFTNLLLEKKPTEEQRKYLEIIGKSADSLRVIINEILDLTKIEAGKMIIEQVQFAPKEVTELVINTLSDKANAKGLELKLDYGSSISKFLIGDPTKLIQILTNLVDNAIKFTEKGNIVLSVIKQGNRIAFSVSDTGIGLSPEQMRIIFEPFRQAEMGTTRKYGGTGLGLYISKQLVELQKGILKVDSEPGKGSTFSFALEYKDSNEKVKVKTPYTISDNIIKELTGMKILLVEDNEFNRLLAAETLQLKIPGTQIDIAINGKEALERLTDHDVIIMDIQMPVMDGYETTEKIRKGFSAPYNQVPIIALTASIIQGDINRCLAAGMNGFVPKPFNTNELLFALYYAKNKKSIELQKKEEEEVISTTNNKTTDLSFLKESCENDEERMRTYVNIYLRSCSKILEALEKALKEEDHITLKNNIHNFKVQIKYMGMVEAGNIADKMESICNEKLVTKELAELYSAFKKHCGISISELSGYMAGNN